jgi:large subunit ribosomal protein L35
MQRLLQMNVVPDLIPSILPTAKLSVSIPSQSSAPIEPGSFLPPAALSQPPQLSLQVFSPGTKQYTLLMLDPDSPDAMAETFTTKVHWIVPNITISPTASQIDSSAPALVPYLAPNPEKGTPYHRYTFLAFAQPEGVQFSVGGSEGKAVSVPEQRTGFNLREWLNEAGLDATAAVGANMVRGMWSDPIKAARVAKTAAAAPGGKRAYSTMSRVSSLRAILLY